MLIVIYFSFCDHESMDQWIPLLSPSLCLSLSLSLITYLIYLTCSPFIICYLFGIYYVNLSCLWFFIYSYIYIPSYIIHSSLYYLCVVCPWAINSSWQFFLCYKPIHKSLFDFYDNMYSRDVNCFIKILIPYSSVMII